MTEYASDWRGASIPTEWEHLFHETEEDELLRRLDANIMWFWEPMMPMGVKPIASVAPFEAAERIRALMARIAEFEAEKS